MNCHTVANFTQLGLRSENRYQIASTIMGVSAGSNSPAVPTLMMDDAAPMVIVSFFL